MTASTEKGMKKETSCFLEKVFIKTRKRELPMLPHRFFSNDSCSRPELALTCQQLQQQNTASNPGFLYSLETLLKLYIMPLPGGLLPCSRGGCTLVSGSSVV